MKFSRIRSHTKQQLLQVFYITFTIFVVAMMFFLNYRHENKLKQTQTRIALLQEQFEEDPRFKNVTLRIDTDQSASVLAGTVNSKEDLKALFDNVFKLPPFTGTHGWRSEVEVQR